MDTLLILLLIFCPYVPMESFGYPPSGPETDRNGNTGRNYSTNYHTNPENGQIFAQKEITNFNYYVAMTYFVS